MSKGFLFILLGALAFIASGVMYWVGSENANLTELKDAWWVPAPLGVVLLMIGFGKTGGG